MGYRVTDVQSTPNPNAQKFILDRPITQQPVSYFSAEAVGNDPVAKALFDIPGVASLLLLGDFVTVNKTPATKWSQVTRKVESVLAKIS